MRFRIPHNGKEIDSADTYAELQAKITDHCSIHDTHEKMWCLPEIIFPIIITTKQTA